MSIAWTLLYTLWRVTNALPAATAESRSILTRIIRKSLQVTVGLDFRGLAVIGCARADNVSGPGLRSRKRRDCLGRLA